MKYPLLIVSGLSLLSACSPKPVVEAPPPYNLGFTTKEIMSSIVDPSAQILWHSAGSVTTDKGEESLTPTTPERWTAVDNAINTVIESGNLLMLPGRARDNGDWMKFAKQMTDAAVVAKAAVIAKDEKGMFDKGGELYEMCSACHAKYLEPFLGPDGKPGKLGPDGKPNPLYHEPATTK